MSALDAEFRRWLDLLTHRESNALLAHGCTSVEQVREMAASNEFRNVPNIGKKSERAILKALDMMSGETEPRFAGETLAPGESTRAVIEPIPTMRWLCFDGAHRHRDQAAAEACIARKPVKVKPEQHWQDAWRRQRDVLARLIGGATYAEIGRDLGVSGGRVGQIMQEGMRRASRDKPPELAGIDGFDQRNLKVLRENADAWLSAIEKVEPPD